jgi:hypothetical protein
MYNQKIVKYNQKIVKFIKYNQKIVKFNILLISILNKVIPMVYEYKNQDIIKLLITHKK